MGTILARFKEPSTWTAIAVLLAVFGVKLAPETIGNVVNIGVVIAGFLGVALPETSSNA